MNVSKFLGQIDSKMPNTFSYEDKIDWINDLEQKLFSNYIEKQSEKTINLIKDQRDYELNGFVFDDIIKVTVNGSVYNLSSVAEHTNGTYFDLEKKIALDPIPNADSAGGLVVVHRWKPALKSVSGKATEELELPDQYVDVYTYALYAKISALRKEFAEYNNWMILFNTELQDLLIKMGNTAPPDARAKNAKRWGRW